jgi:hypothetical protein
MTTAMFFSSCAMTSGAKESFTARESKEARLQALGPCILESYPEGILAVGLGVAMVSPAAPAVAATYYSSVLIRCSGSRVESISQTADAKKLRRDIESRIEESREESIRSSSIQINRLADRIREIQEAEVKNLDRLKQSAAKISKESEVEIRRAADEAIRDVYRQMDEIRRVKIQVIEDDSDIP